jgi:hypothetical protein
MLGSTSTVVRTLYIAGLTTIVLVTLGRQTLGSQMHLTDLLPPRARLVSLEVFHLPDNAEYRASVSLDVLISPMRPRDYARISVENKSAFDKLFRALSETSVDTSAACAANSVDVRWAIVLNYNDHKEAIGLNRTSDCVQLLSKKDPLRASPHMIAFVDSEFAFMR